MSSFDLKKPSSYHPVDPSNEMSFSENKNSSNMVYGDRNAYRKFEFKDLTESIQLGGASINKSNQFQPFNEDAM